MSKVNDFLISYPSLHRKYAKAYRIYENCIMNFPLHLYYLQARMKNDNKKIILCYPERPNYSHTLEQVCRFSNFTITNKPQKVDAVIHFEDTTYREYDSVLSGLNKKYRVINYRCSDISKANVDKIHKKVFGYGLTINPQTYKGKYVKKGNLNSLHNGVILDHPEKPQKGFVYQTLINTESNGELIEARFPIFGKKAPFVYLKYRPLDNRFGSKNNRIEVVQPEKVVSKDEYKKILEFCQEIGLDCGELDVLRDNKTKKIYIIDVNNTPSSPPYEISFSAYKKCLQMMSDAFKQAFL
jgi:hypothetical protein